MNSPNKYLDRVIFWVSNQPAVSSPASVYYFYSPGDNFCYEESQSRRGDLVSVHQTTSDNIRILHFTFSSLSDSSRPRDEVDVWECWECWGRERGINTVNDQWSINGSNSRPISSLIGGNTKNWSIYRGLWDTWAGLPPGNILNLPSIINNSQK